MNVVLIILVAAYPIVYAFCWAMHLLLRTRVPRLSPADQTPFVSIIISSSGEDEATSRSKLMNTLELDYPREKMEIILFSDGCPLPERLRSEFPAVKMAEFPPLGKTECQNRSIAMAEGELIVSTDVTALLDKQALRKCVRWYADSRVGAVGGAFTYHFKKGNPEFLYMRRENEKKKGQAAFGLVMGYLGPFYSFRKSLYETLPPFYQSDYILPICVASRGAIAYFDGDIVAVRRIDRPVGREYARKRRIVAQAIATTLDFLARRKKLVFTRPDIFFAIMRFKLLRWFFLPYLFLLYLALWAAAPALSSAVTIAALVIILFSWSADYRKVQTAWIKAPYYASLLFVANMNALFDALSGNTYTKWEPGSR